MAGFEKKQQILSVLSDGKFHSGEALGQMLGVSRAAVGKHINQLTELGIEIFRVSGKGYCLADHLVLLNEQQIRVHSKGSADIEVKHVIGSTNDYLLQQVRSGTPLTNGRCVVAECQTAGRGRRGRAWVSPFGSHIYFSMFWQLDGISQAMGLSIAVGIAIREAIQASLNAPVQLKWPNDLLVHDEKIAGILVELEGQTDGPCGVVIGIGINVNMPEGQGGQIDQPWTDMVTHSEQEIDRNVLVAKLIAQLQQQLQIFQDKGLKRFVEQWNQYDRYLNQPVSLLMGNKTVKGIGKGIDSQGGIMLLESGANQAKAYYGGEISLRGQK
jgi:BirA family biotin operon repressor/biotin-[acetyl-CoA-carboxylase] ligase